MSSTPAPITPDDESCPLLENTIGEGRMPRTSACASLNDPPPHMGVSRGALGGVTTGGRGRTAPGDTLQGVIPDLKLFLCG